MLEKIVKLLEEQTQILKEINAKLSNQTVIPSAITSNIQEGTILGIPKDMLLVLAEQYQKNPDVVIQPDAVVEVLNGNMFIKSKAGRINVNLTEKNNGDVKSSFISSVKQKGQKLFVEFNSGKTYQYTSTDTEEFNRVAELLLTSTYVSKPFLRQLRSNRSFDYQVVQ